jgi:hypothetical protein
MGCYYWQVITLFCISFISHQICALKDYFSQKYALCIRHDITICRFRHTCFSEWVPSFDFKLMLRFILKLEAVFLSVMGRKFMKHSCENRILSFQPYKIKSANYVSYETGSVSLHP